MAAPSIASDMTPVKQEDDSNGHKSDVSDKQTLLAVLQFLRKNNLKDTEELLKKEASITDEEAKTETLPTTESDVSHALAAYKSDDDPTLYDDYYTDLKTFIESCLDVHKVELSMIMYPIFVHMYLELVYNSHEAAAVNFFGKFALDQEEYYRNDLVKLSTVVKQEHMKGNQLMENFKSSKFVIKMSRDSYTHLKRHIQERHMMLLLTIIQEHLFIDVFDGIPRNRQQIEASIGGMLGEAERDANKSKVLYGLLKEPDLSIPMDDDEDVGEGDDRPKKKKQKKDPLLLKKSKNDPNAPALTRIPLPELKDQDKAEKMNTLREAVRRVKVGPGQLPSICFYTFLNAYQGVTCLDVSDDSSLVAAGFADSVVRVWTLTPAKLRSVKEASDLGIIDKETDDVLERMMDDRSGSDCRSLLGHSGPVYATSFSSDRNFLLSASEDGSIRLWSGQTWTNLVCYKGHNYPVWSVKFSPHGHYFVSGGHDRTVRLWSTDHYQPVRLFAGHLSDVDCVLFHPNSNYIASGSSDRTVQLWDVLSGHCIRTLTGHKGTVHALCFSPEGRYLASSGVDHMVLLWEISSGNLFAQLKGHTDAIYSLCFSREGSVLASGGLDNNVRLWDIHKVFDEHDTESDASIPSTIHTNDNPNFLIGSFPTKSTPVICVHFTRRNLLLGIGPFTMS